MKISDLIKTFLYTHPVYSHTKKLLEQIETMEEEYLRQIASLKQDIALSVDQQASCNRDADAPNYEKDQIEIERSDFYGVWPTKQKQVQDDSNLTDEDFEFIGGD